MEYLNRLFSLSPKHIPKNISSLPLTRNFSSVDQEKNDSDLNSLNADKDFRTSREQSEQSQEEDYLKNESEHKFLSSNHIKNEILNRKDLNNGNIVKTLDYLTNFNDDPIVNDIPQPKSTPKILKEETIFMVALQIFIPYIVAGLGMVAAGVVLDKVQHWAVFEAVTELYILIPPLLGLKGNLEMTLASRISTQANLGYVDTTKDFLKMTKGNMSLLQVQAICLGLYASIIALLIGFIPDGGTVNWLHAQILLTSCLITTTLSSGILGIIMITVVYMTRKYHLNPDNIATPMAASLGDLVTLGILALISRMLFQYANIYNWICIPIILAYLLFIPLWFIVSRRNLFVKKVLTTGWIPIIASMTISSLGGLILDYTVRSFNGIAVYQPVINGVGGNLVAIQASRLSTDFHKLGPPGTFGTNNRPRDYNTDEPGPLISNKPLPPNKLKPKLKLHVGNEMLQKNGYYPSSAISPSALNLTIGNDEEDLDNQSKTKLNGAVSRDTQLIQQANHLPNEFPTLRDPLPKPNPATFNLCGTFCSSAFNSKMTRLLLFFALPGHLLFLFLISFIKNGRITITLYFALFYMGSAMIQVVILLYLANVLTLAMWKHKTDPDNAAIPYLTAIGDFLGIGLLSLSFFVLYRINPKDPNLDVG